MRTSLLLERIQKMPRVDVRQDAVANYAHAVEKIAMDLEWLLYGETPEALAIKMALKEEPKLRRPHQKLVADIRKFSKAIRKTQDAIDITPAGSMVWAGRGARV